MLSTLVKVLKWLVYAALSLISIFLGWVYFSTYHPKEIESEPVVSVAPAPILQQGQQLKILSWNVQFMAGNKDNHFFFDKGEDEWPSMATVSKTVASVANIIKQENPDVILLQEVDDGSKRTHYKDQLQLLLDLLPSDYVNHTSTFYWLADFVPHPAIMGAAGMKLSIISKYKLEGSTRYALSAITSDDIIVRQFNVKRAVLGAYLPVEGGGKVHVLNTHLSAFAQGTDTMYKQVALIKGMLDTFKQQGDTAIIAGDFNLLPSVAAFESATATTRGYYNPQGSELTPLLKQYSSIPSLAETMAEKQQQWFTHMPSRKADNIPDKTIDYAFYLGDLALGKHYVLSEGVRDISDHLPLVANFTVQ